MGGVSVVSDLLVRVGGVLALPKTLGIIQLVAVGVVSSELLVNVYCFFLGGAVGFMAATSVRISSFLREGGRRGRGRGGREGEREGRGRGRGEGGEGGG